MSQWGSEQCVRRSVRVRVRGWEIGPFKAILGSGKARGFWQTSAMLPPWQTYVEFHASNTRWEDLKRVLLGKEGETKMTMQTHPTLHVNAHIYKHSRPRITHAHTYNATYGLIHGYIRNDFDTFSDDAYLIHAPRNTPMHQTILVWLLWFCSFSTVLSGWISTLGILGSSSPHLSPCSCIRRHQISLTLSFP